METYLEVMFREVRGEERRSEGWVIYMTGGHLQERKVMRRQRRKVGVQEVQAKKGSRSQRQRSNGVKCQGKAEWATSEHSRLDFSTGKLLVTVTRIAVVAA